MNGSLSLISIPDEHSKKKSGRIYVDQFAEKHNIPVVKSIAYAGNIADSVLFCLENIREPLFIYNYCDYPQNNMLEQSKLISSLLGFRKPFQLPFWITKFVTIPIDILERMLKTALKINSMRVKKFTTPTCFLSDKVRSRGFEQKTSIKEGFFKTKSWVESVDVKVLRETWFRKASLK